MKLTKRNRLIITLIITLLVWGHILWDYFHGGIPTHYILQDGNLPGIPNWVGGIVLPFFTWLLLYRIQKRVNAPDAKDTISLVGYRFLAALAIAVLISIFFSTGIDVIDFIMLAILVLSFVFPLYKSEYLLGWVLGSAFTFGAIIPISFGSVLALLFFVLFQLTRSIVGFTRPKLK